MTVKSMTAFARTSGNLEACQWTWEIKSVNSKGLDIRFRMPPGFDALDIAVRERVSKALKRGNLFIALSLKWHEGAGTVRINEALLSQLSSLGPTLSKAFPDAAPLTQDGLLGLRGLVEMEDVGSSPEILKGLSEPLLAGFDESLAKLVDMRADEGARLAETLGAQLDEIDALRVQAGNTAAAQPDALRERMKTLVEDIVGQVPALPEDRLAQEVAVLITKADVREELDRLEAHVLAAREIMAQSVPVGRKLDFLCQEFNREANTLCSKAQALELTNIGLELKAVIEQFREQVQNIE